MYGGWLKRMKSFDYTENEEIKENLERLLLEGHVFICGFGTNGEIIDRWLNNNSVKITAFIDKRYKKTGSRVKCIRYGDLKKYSGKRVVLMSSFKYSHEMINDLLDAGCDREEIIRIEPHTVSAMIESMSKPIRPESNLGRLKNNHNGQRAFIIGNGPSLTIGDLDLIKDEISFATNEIYGAFSFTDWRPTYYIIHDRVGSKMNFKTKSEFEWMLKNCKDIICSNLTSKYEEYGEGHYSNLLFYKALLHKDGKSSEIYSFSEDITKGIVDAAGTSVYVMYQLAVYMGIKEIYLLGMDCSFEKEYVDGEVVEDKSKKNHADFIREIDGLEDIYNINGIVKCHRSADAYAISHDIKIYNATRGGELEVFERVNLDDIMLEARRNE